MDMYSSSYSQSNKTTFYLYCNKTTDPDRPKVMENWRRKLKQKKFFYFQKYLPYCILSFLLLASVAIIRQELKTSIFLFNCAASTPGEVVRCTENPAKKNSVVDYHDVIFRRLLKEGYLSPTSKAICMIEEHDVVNALKNIGVFNVHPVSYSNMLPVPDFKLKNDSIDFAYFGSNSRFNWLENPSKFAQEIGRTLKVGGYLVIHIVLNDKYSFNSFINLFTCCTLIMSRPIRGLENTMPSMQEILLIKHSDTDTDRLTSLKCKKNLKYNQELVENLEPLITFEQPTTWDGPWGDENTTLHYLPSMVDLSFKERYIYVDVGANSFNSSIGSWFLKEYPKQNKAFEIFAIEADENFHEEYKKIKETKVTLLPFAAWVRNETLTFNVYEEPTSVTHTFEKMGRIPDELVKIEDKVLKKYNVEAFDLADWLLRTLSKKDFVVMKMDVEGAEGALLKRLEESGAMCLIDELFLECHYDRSYEKTNKYKLSFAGCINLFKKLRRDGFVVHQWW